MLLCLQVVRRAMCVLGAVALAAGCAARQSAHLPDQHVAVEDPQKARIYVIRQPTFWRFNLVVLTKRIRVRDGFQEIGSIAGQRGFVAWERGPGNVSVLADEAFLSVNVEQGRTYYILARDELVINRMIVRLELVDEHKGRKALAKATPPEQIEGPRLRTSGVSGPVEWRTEEIESGPRYSFVLILKETRGTSITFTTIERRQETRLEVRGLIMPNRTSRSTSLEEGAWHLPAGGELRLPFGFVLVCHDCQSWTPVWNIVLTGKDEAGQDVQVIADVTLPPVAN